MSQRKSAQLTDTQLIILSSAAQRDDGLAVLPETLKGGAAQKVLAKLTASAFLKEVRAKPDQPAWRTDETGHPVGLKITKAGEAAIGIEDRSPDLPTRSSRGGGRELDAMDDNGRAAQQQPRTGSKQALVISLLRRDEGATLDDLVAATEWLPHTTRAALTGLRKKGYAVEKSKREDSKTVYALRSAAPSKLGHQRRRSGKRKAA